MNTYDHIIVGSGQATGTLLGKLIPTGDSIAVIEGGKVGGSCVNYGCTPTKTMVACARAVQMSRRGDFFGFKNSEPIVDYDRVRERMNEVRNASSNGLAGWIESTENIDLIREWASFESSHVLNVGAQQIEGKKIYINVGTSPAAPPIDGIDNVSWLDSAGLLDLEKQPEHLLIIGGGYIGMEFAQVYNRLGTEVTIIQRGSQVMPQEDQDVSLAIQEILEGEGVNILCGASAKSVSKENNGIILTIEKDGLEKEIVGSHLLVAAGRKPNTHNLGLDKAGIKTNARGFIEVNTHCQTNVKDVFAVGDVNGHGAFTHTAVNDGEIVLDYLFGGNRNLSKRIPIYGLFTDPPLGRVGMTEKEALSKGYRIMKATKAMSTISRAKEMGETQGFAKLIVDAETDLILGGSILGPGGDEIINMFAAIMHSHIPCKSYREVVLVHPTVSELMPYVLDGLQLVE
ncbi:MAG: mercuric reductase [Cyclobacteriaceae bacterium]|nr:mercuric reductase [Cyclobacteriaceae bacterium HetDA_MAG_MS6]